MALAMSVLVLILVAAAGYVVLTSRTGTPPGGTQSTTSSAACTFGAEGFLLMKVMNDSNGQPAGSLPPETLSVMR